MFDIFQKVIARISLSKAKWAGREAALLIINEKQMTSCPYAVGTPERYAYYAGFADEWAHHYDH